MTEYVFLIELLVFSGAALAWGFWELWSLRRERLKDEAKAEAARRSGPPGHAERQE